MAIQLTTENNKFIISDTDTSQELARVNRADIQDIYHGDRLYFFHSILGYKYDGIRRSGYALSELVDGDSGSFADLNALKTYLSDKTGFVSSEGGVTPDPPTFEDQLKAASTIWLKPSEGVILSATGNPLVVTEKSNNGYHFQQPIAADQLSILTNEIDGKPAIGTPGFAAESKFMQIQGANPADFRFLHDGTTPFTIWLVAKGYDGTTFSASIFGTVTSDNPSVLTTGFVINRGIRTHVKNSGTRESATNDNNIGYHIFKTGLRINGNTKTLFSQVNSDPEVTRDVSGFTFDSGDAEQLPFIGRFTGNGALAIAECIVVESPSSAIITGTNSYLATEFPSL